MRTVQRIAIACGLVMGLAITGCKKQDNNIPPNTTVSTVPAGTPVIGPDGKVTNAPVGGENVLIYPDGSVHAVPAGMQVTPGQVIGGVNAPAPAGTTTTPAPVPAVPSTASSGPTAVPAPVESAPAPVPVAMTVPAGTRITIRTTETLTGHKANLGERFSGVVAEPVVVRGRTVFGRGTRVSGSVIQANGRGKFAGSGSIGITLNEVGGYNVSTSSYVKEIKGKGKRTAGFIGGGAGVGALIGGLAGGGKGALIGGLSGAGAGTAAGAMTGNKEVVIPSESVITFRLRSAITVR